MNTEKDKIIKFINNIFEKFKLTNIWSIDNKEEILNLETTFIFGPMNNMLLNMLIEERILKNDFIKQTLVKISADTNNKVWKIFIRNENQIKNNELKFEIKYFIWDFNAEKEKWLNKCNEKFKNQKQKIVQFRDSLIKKKNCKKPINMLLGKAFFTDRIFSINFFMSNLSFSDIKVLDEFYCYLNYNDSQKILGNWFDEILALQFLILFISKYQISNIKNIYKFESPDFVIKLISGEIIGIEVIKAMNIWHYSSQNLFNKYDLKYFINRNVYFNNSYSKYGSRNYCGPWYDYNEYEDNKKNIAKHFKKIINYKNNIKSNFKNNSNIIFILLSFDKILDNNELKILSDLASENSIDVNSIYIINSNKIYNCYELLKNNKVKEEF